MTTTALLNIPALLKPIPGDNPAGTDLRADASPTSLYQKIKDARTAARDLERQQIQGLEATANQQPDWQSVYQLALEILATQSKDLEITAWLIEALLRQHGFAGLREGFHLTRQLVENFADQIYPIPDEDGLHTRVMPLIGLNGEETDGTLIVPMALVELTEGRSAGPFSLWQYQQALDVSRIVDPDKRTQRINAGAVTLEMLELAASETATEFFENLTRDLQSCIDEFAQLNNLLFEKYGEHAPPSSRIQTQLNNCLDCIKTISKTIQPEFSADSIAIPNEEIILVEDNHSFRSREKVLQTLLQSANYFRQAEPHSPISYLLERTVRWGRMSLPELLKEIVSDEQARISLCVLTGIKT